MTMTHFYIITLFPQTFEGFLKTSIIGRAIGKKIIRVDFINPRDFATDKHKSVDDKPYGGGKGMVMRVDVVKKAIDSLPKDTFKILLSASGKKYNQKSAQKLSTKDKIALICGHYEGLDARVEKYVDDIISTGDYVTTGGEIPAMAVVDSVARLLPGTITEGSTLEESFSSNTLEYPQYTRPENFEGSKVPKVLLSGNHKQIESWRKEQSAKRTKKFRPDIAK